MRNMAVTKKKSPGYFSLEDFLSIDNLQPLIVTLNPAKFSAIHTKVGNSKCK